MKVLLLTAAPGVDGKVGLGRYTLDLPVVPSMGDYMDLNSYGIPLGVLRVQDRYFDLDEPSLLTLDLALYNGIDDMGMADTPEELVPPASDPNQELIDVMCIHRGFESFESVTRQLRYLPEVGNMLTCRELTQLYEEETEYEFEPEFDTENIVVINRLWTLNADGRHACELLVDWVELDMVGDSEDENEG